MPEWIQPLQSGVYPVQGERCGGGHSRCSAWCLCPFSLWGHALKQSVYDFLDCPVMDTDELTCLPPSPAGGQCCCNYPPVSQVCSQTRCCCEQKERHIDMKRPHRQDLCGRCRGKRISCDTTYSYKYIVWTEHPCYRLNYRSRIRLSPSLIIHGWHIWT